MQNQTYFMLIFLSFAVFLSSSANLALIEEGMLGEDNLNWNLMLCTISFMTFDWSILTLYHRAANLPTRDVSKILKKFTLNNIRANTTGVIARKMRNIFKNIRAGASPATILGLVVGFFVLAYTTPVALNYIAVAVNASVNSSVKTIVTIIVPIVFALAMVLHFMPGGKK